MYLNRLTLIGFTGGDAETKTISNGSTFTAFSVATQRSWKNSEGVWESPHRMAIAAYRSESWPISRQP